MLHKHKRAASSRRNAKADQTNTSTETGRSDSGKLRATGMCGSSGKMFYKGVWPRTKTRWAPPVGPRKEGSHQRRPRGTVHLFTQGLSSVA